MSCPAQPLTAPSTEFQPQTAGDRPGLEHRSGRLMGRTALGMLGLGALIGALLGNPVSVGAAAAETTGKPAKAEDDLPPIPPGFTVWRDSFRARAIRSGISGAVYDDAMSGVTPDARVIKRNNHQPEFSRPIWAYLDGAVSDTRVSKGRDMLAANAALLARVEAAYGVPPRIIVAIWGLETAYGRITGDYDIIRSLSTLAYSGRRAAFGERELLNALKIIQAGDKPRSAMKGSWAGAMGQSQFMPSSFLSYAVDFDGDGRRDIWDSRADVFASIANYLAKAKWDPDFIWGREIVLPESFNYALAGRSVKRSLSEWRALGVQLPGGAPVPTADLTASVIVPGGHQGPAFFVYPNFRAIMRYNPATAYALGIGHLSDRIVGKPPIRAQWPRHLQPLSRDQKLELQSLLSRAGYGIGQIDGVVGAKTRAAVRAFQADRGLTADGFVSSALLEQVRRHAGG